MRADAFLLVVPEYNCTMPAFLKNVIDWLSRLYGAGALSDNPVAVIGTAFGTYGGVWAQDDIRKAARVAGDAVIEDVMFCVPASLTRFAEIHPLDDLEVATELSSVVARLGSVAAAA